MIREIHVPFKIARLLEEKGFDETCYACYEYFESSITLYKGWLFEYKGTPVTNSQYRVKCPTHQMAMKWLREELGIYIEIRRNLNTFYFKWCIQEGAIDKAFSEYTYKSYEEAVEAALEYYLTKMC